MVKKGQNIDHVVIECPLLPHNIKRKAFVSFYMRHFSFFVLLFCQETRDVQKKKSFYVLHCQTSRRRSRHTQGDLTQMFPTIPNPIQGVPTSTVSTSTISTSTNFIAIGIKLVLVESGWNCYAVKLVLVEIGYVLLTSTNFA